LYRIPVIILDHHKYACVFVIQHWRAQKIVTAYVGS